MLGIYCALTLVIASADPIEKLPTGSAGPATEIMSGDASQTSGTDAAAQAAAGERYLLLDNNTIVAAQKIEELPDQYRIERSGARMGLPKSKVRFVGESLESVYRYRAERIPIHDSHMRADFSQWCFNQGLVEYANAEALLVLKIDPENESAKRVMKMCDTKLHPPERVIRTAGSDASAPSRRPRDPDPSRVVKKFKAAYGQELFNRYRDLEPLLSSSCGNAACHGGIRHDGPFRLYRRTDGIPNDIRLTSRNLTSMLDAIDYHDPLRSPLLFKALERHGASTLPPLGGVQDPTYVALQEWVMEVTKRWSTNEIEIDPSMIEGPDEASQRAKDNSFGSLRAEQSKNYVRTGRPMRPTMVPGDEIHQMRTGPVYADDAPAESSPGIPHESPAPRIIPDEPMPGEKISADEMTAPVSDGKPQAESKKPGAFRATATRLVEMVRGKPRVKQSIRLNNIQQGTRDGYSFEAATPPMNLVPSFEDVNQTLHQNVEQ